VGQSSSNASGLPRALIAALPLSVAVTIASELAQVLLQAPGPDMALAFGAASELTWAFLVTAWLPCTVLITQAGVLAWARRRPTHRRGAAVAVLLLSLLQGGLVHVALTAETQLGDYSLLWFVTLGFGVMQAGAFVAAGSVITAAAFDSHPRARLALRRGAAAVFALGAAATWMINYVWYPSFYLPSEALSVFVLLCAVTAFALVGTEARVRRTMLVSGGALILFCGAGLLVPSLRLAARPSVYQHSALGRALGIRQALAREAERGTRLLPEASRQRELRPDPDGLARFAEFSRLPPLPDDFALGDHDVVYILSESFRYEETSLADPSLETTPVLADFARQSMTFSHATSPSIGTFPSLTALLSMTTPSFAAVDVPPSFWTGRLRADATTAPEVLAEDGYETFWAGHNFQGVFDTALLGVRERFEETHLIEIPHDEPTPNDEDIANAAIATIRRHRAADRRFFGLIFFSAPHDAYRAHDPGLPSARPIDRYRQELRFVDEQIGRVLDELQRDGGDERTVVIISGDHGEAFGEHRFDYHSTSVHQEQSRVPLLVHVPGLAPAEVHLPTSNTYVLPWLLLRGPRAAREAAERVIREDLGPLFRDTEGAVLVEMVSRRYQRTALRYPHYTLIHDLFGDVTRIYDTDRDPGEQEDLGPLDPGLRQRFRARIEGYRRARFEGQRFVFIEPLPSRR